MALLEHIRGSLLEQMAFLRPSYSIGLPPLCRNILLVTESACVKEAIDYIATRCNNAVIRRISLFTPYFMRAIDQEKDKKNWMLIPSL